MFVSLSKKTWFLLFLLPLNSMISFAKSSAKKETEPTQLTKKRPVKKARLTRPHSDVLWKNLTEQQLIDQLDYARATRDSELECKILLHLSKTAKQQSNLKKYLLQLADFYFNQKSLPKALEYYTAYGTLFPGSLNAEYAAYKALITSFYTTLEPNRDTTPTEQTITLATEFLKTALNEDYRTEAVTIIQQCTQKLFTHELYVFDHYIKQKKYSSAQHRLEYIEKQFKTLADAQRLLPHLQDILATAQDPKTRSFFIGVDFDYGIEPKTTRLRNKAQKRHVDRIKV